MIASITFVCNACRGRVEVSASSITLASRRLVDEERWIVRWGIAGSDHYCASCRSTKEAAEEAHKLRLHAAKGG